MFLMLWIVVVHCQMPVVWTSERGRYSRQGKGKAVSSVALPFEVPFIYGGWADRLLVLAEKE